MINANGQEPLSRWVGQQIKGNKSNKKASIHHIDFNQIMNTFIQNVAPFFDVSWLCYWGERKKKIPSAFAAAANTFSARSRWFEAKAAAQLWIYTHILSARVHAVCEQS